MRNGRAPPCRLGYERLLRHLLALPNTPAVVPVHAYSPGISRRLFWDTRESVLACKPAAGCCPCSHAPCLCACGLQPRTSFA